MNFHLYSFSTAAFLALASLDVQSQQVDQIVLTIHANVDATTQAPAYLRKIQSLRLGYLYQPLQQLLGETESISRGHAWISVKKNNVCTTYGLFGDGPNINHERNYLPGIQRSVEISELHLKNLMIAISARKEYQWTGYYNCASYASELWQSATGELINPVPVGTYYVDNSGQRVVIRKNVKLNPLPPAPLGIVQSIIASANGKPIVSNDMKVCP